MSRVSERGMVPIVKIKTYPISHKAKVSSSTLFRVKGVFITLRSTTDGEGGKVKVCDYLKGKEFFFYVYSSK